MKYKIGDVARILGISTDLLRYYEKKGVVTPTKDKNNDYRYYDAWDINFLMDCLWFKNFGFSIEQIADMVRINSVSEISSLFEYKETELRATIRRCELLLKRSEQHRSELERLPRLLNRCEVADSPELVRYINRVGDEYQKGNGLERLARQWLSLMPFIHRYFAMSGFNPRTGEQEGYRWGFALDMEYVRELEVEIEPPVVYIPSKKSIHTVFSSHGKGNFSPRHLDYALEYARENGYKVCGPARGLLMASVLEDDVLTGYFEAWIPIE